MALNEFLRILDKYHKRLTRQQYKTIRGQAYKGDIPGAMRGIKTVMER